MTELLRQVPGVGPLTALTYVLTLEDPTRFPRSRTVGAYLGLRPKRRDSGAQQPELSITKAGDVLLRRHLVTAAQYILGPFGPDTDLRRWGLALAGRGGKAAKSGRGGGAEAGRAAASAVVDGRGVRTGGLSRAGGIAGPTRPAADDGRRSGETVFG